MKKTIYRHERVIWLCAVMLVILAGGILAGVHHRRLTDIREETETLHRQLEQWRQEAQTMRAQLARRPAPAPPEAKAREAAETPEPTDHGAAWERHLAEHVAAWERRVADRDGEIAALRRQLADARTMIDSESVPEAEETPAPERADRRAAWRERMQGDPEERARRQAERAERLDHVADMMRERSEFIQRIPTEGLAPEYLENHQALIERLDFFAHAAARIAADPEGSETRELMPELFRNLQGLDSIMEKQRTLMLDDLAHDMGYQGEEAEVFVNTIHKITEVTTLPSPGVLRGGARGRGDPRRESATPRVTLP